MCKIRKLFFERMEEAEGRVPKTFKYDSLPEKIRNQIMIIWGNSYPPFAGADEAVEVLREAIGVFQLAPGWVGTRGRETWFACEELKNFFLNTDNVQHALTCVEEIGRSLFKYRSSENLDKINERLKTAGIGWKHTGEFLIPIEDEVFFEETTSKCLSILSQKKYHDTQQYLIKAYEELRQGVKNHDDALTDCRMALETIIKTRLLEVGYTDLDDLNWFKLKPLLLKSIQAPSYWENYVNNFFSLMEGNITPSNKEGSHGQPEGKELQADDTFVRYIINQTATNILFIAEAKFRKK